MTDKAPVLLFVFKKLKEQGFDKHTIHCTIKRLNNFLEQNYSRVKCCFVKFAGFQNLRHASLTLNKMKMIHTITIYKQKRSLQPNFVFSTYNRLQQLLTIT